MPARPPPAPPPPVYLLAGGRGARRDRGDPLLAEIMSSAGTPRPRVAYVGAPSDDNRAFFAMISALLKGAGAGKVELVRLASRKPDLGRARAIVEAADIVYITGGDVEHGMQVLDRTGFLPVLRERHEAGVPFFGLSAGSIMLASRWVRWEDPDDDATASAFPCMGFAPVVCDTHSEADDWVELVALLRLLPRGTVGHGIATNTGIRVARDGSVTAMGGPVHRFRREASGVKRIDDLLP